MSVGGASEMQSPVLSSPLVEEEAEPLLDSFSAPIDKKVSACKEVLYSGMVGGAVGLVTGLALSGLAYANGGSAACLAVGCAADTVAGAVGAMVGTAAKRVLKNKDGPRSIRVLCGAYGVAASALCIYNTTAWGLTKATPAWMQCVIGAPAALAGAFICAYPNARLGTIMSGFFTSSGTGSLVGFGLGTGLGALVPQVGIKTGSLLGLMGVQAMCGYIVATDKFRSAL